MKVNNNSSKTNAANLSRNIEADKKVKGEATRKGTDIFNAGETAGAANVKMSSDVMGMQKAKEIAGKVTVDEAKVARLQKLIDQGKYRVDAEAVADRMVDEHLATGE